MADREPEEVRRGDSIGKTVPDGWHTPSQAAAKVGRSADTLKRWRVKRIYVPSGWIRRGNLRVYLYSDDDVEALKVLARTIRAGRPSTSEDA